jgi:serine/threonine protein kinase
MARVYYGTDIRLKRPVAIKVLDERLQARPAYAERFVREAQIVATWRHENILQVYYADETEGIYYFVTEYIDGANLEKLLENVASQNELLPHADILRIGRAIASAIDYAHRQGVVHRDVKPANVLIERSGRVVLSDFGLSLEVQRGTLGEVVGSPHYISPEQARQSSEAVPASDFYSLGVILYEMLTGKVPFDDPSPFTIALQHVTLPPPPPRELNPALNQETEQVLLKALSKAPQERYQSGKELVDALEAALSAPPPIHNEAAALPPVPAGVPVQSRRISRLTLMDILAEHPPQTAELPPKTSSRLPESLLPSPRSDRPSRPGNKAALPALLGGCAVISLLAVISVLVLLLGNLEPSAKETQQTQPTRAVFVPPGTITQTGTSPAVSTPTTASTPVEATATTTPPPTETPAPAGQAAAPEPTVKYPQGRHLQLFYNENSFYIHNLTDERIAFEPIAFERLDASGEPTNRFDGTEWAMLYTLIWPKNCLKAEIRDNYPYLSPSACLGYNATRTFKQNEKVVFWTERQGSTQFRVLWDEEEIARCEIEEGICDIYLP